MVTEPHINSMRGSLFKEDRHTWPRKKRNRRPSHLRPADLVKRLLARFGPEDRVLVIIAADPDALASSLALKRLLWRKVANVTIAHVNQISRPDNLAMTRLLNIPLTPWTRWT